MATSGCTQKVQDHEYKNWLRVGLALYYLKDGITCFVQGEVDAMHQSLLQKLHGGTSVPAYSRCQYCKAKKVKWIRVECKISPPCPSGVPVCDNWLLELLQLHNSPTSRTVCPENCDAADFPFNSWECAKLYIPRNQNKTNTGPVQCDIQAFLNLMSNCKQFHVKLSPNGRMLINKVLEARNTVMHSGDMKITDSERDRFMQDIIQLLTDPFHLQSLASCKNAVTEINKINNDSEDIFINPDLEMTALRECVMDIKKELGVHTNKVKESIEEVRELRELQEKTVEAIGDLNKAMKEMSTKLQEQDARYSQMGSSAGPSNMPKIELLYSRCNDVRDFTSGQDGKTGIPDRRPENEAPMQLKCIPDRGQEREGRKQLKNIYDRRPESEGLKQLKTQTENNLGTMKKLGFIPTKQAVKADELLQQNNCLIIKGNPGEGKTTTSQHLIDKDKYRNRRVVIKSLDDWKLVDTDWVDIVVVEDIFGRFDLDPGLQQGWMFHLQNLQNHIDAENLEVIITSRTDVWAKATDIMALPFLSDEFSLTLSSNCLEYSEKLGILNMELSKRKKILEDDEKEKCISNFQGLLGFPQCCSVFVGDETLFKDGASFFKHPENMFYENIRHLKSGFLSFAFLFCLSEISEEFLSDEMMSESNKNLLLELVAKLKSHFSISEKDASIKLLSDSYELYTGVYFVQSNLCIHFSHATVYEAVGRVLGELCPEILMKYCSSDFLHQKVYAAKSRDKSSLKVYVPVSAYGCLAVRLMKEVAEERHVQIVMAHSALKQEQFWKMLRKQCLQCPKIREFLTTESVSSQRQSNPVGSDGVVRTFLQHILKKDVKTAMFAFDHLSEFLECSHKRNTSDCWQCKEKQNLLEISLYYRHFDIADKMLKMNAELSSMSLCNAARHGNLKWVKSTIENLKQKVFNPNERTVKEALCAAYRSGNQDVIECLLKETIIMDLQCIGHVAKNSNASSLAKVLEHLKKNDRWEPASHDASQTLLHAFLDQKTDIRDLLVKEGVSLTMEDLPSEEITFSVLKSLIQHLQYTNHWNPDSQHATQLLQLSFLLGIKDAIDLLIQEGVMLTMEDLCNSDKMRSSRYVDSVICHLKDTNKWDCKSLFASNALKHAYWYDYSDVIDLLHKEGVSLTIEHLPESVLQVSPKHIIKIIQDLKDTNQWDAKSPHVTEALQIAHWKGRNNVVDLLNKEEVSSIMDIFHPVITSFLSGSIDEVFQHLEPVVNSILSATLNLEGDMLHQKGASGSTIEKLPDEVVLESSNKDIETYVVDHHHQEGISSLWNLIVAVMMGSSEQTKKVIEDLKIANQWDANLLLCIPLLFSYLKENDDLIDLLHNEGAYLTMEVLPVLLFMGSLKCSKKEIQHLKDTNQWNPKSSFGPAVLHLALNQEKYEVAELIQQEGISLSMNCLLLTVLFGSSKRAARLIQHYRDVNQWDPKSPELVSTLYVACLQENNNMIDLLHTEGVFLTMEVLQASVFGSVKHVSKVINDLKGTNQWNPRSHLASDALHVARVLEKSDVIDLLYNEGVLMTKEIIPGEYIQEEDTNKCDANEPVHRESASLTMESLPTLACKGSSSTVTTVIESLKSNNRWDPKSSYASYTLLLAFLKERDDVIDLLQQEGVSLTMQDLQIYFTIGSSKQVLKVIQHLKDTNHWDPRSNVASDLLCLACSQHNNNVIDVLHQEGVSIKCIDMCTLIIWDSEVAKREIQYLRDSEQLSLKVLCASVILSTDSLELQNGLIDLLYQEDGSLDLMVVLPTLFMASSEHGIRLIEFLQNTNKWDSNSLDAFMISFVAYWKKNNYNINQLVMEDALSEPFSEIFFKRIEKILSQYMILKH